MARININELSDQCANYEIEELDLDQMKEVSGGGFPGAVVAGTLGAAGTSLGSALGYIGSRTLQGRPLEYSGLADATLTGLAGGALGGAAIGAVGGALPN